MQSVAKKKILFVDDNQSVLVAGKLLIKSLGHEIILADSGEKAIEIIRECPYKIEIIFLDLTMPGIGGVGVLKFMRKRRIKIPIIVQTGVTCLKEFKKTYGMDIVGCLEKPYTKEDMAKLIDCAIIRETASSS